ncbi:efflux RND transporter permease subunit [Zavarzinia compransoris]|uniref:MFS transporter n=1 Tax=Zavarzinia compransoris TaxID=1264899 RepID=A0A317E3S4_9PROT|nr:efflux RND transporter permease subunit [Zavarzinia compransoris]PWR19715.1 MFS transporter [Zavarzinia compransoris]TDP43338.1 multidrug efflux pump [Zavarzinia compransoris]
MNAIIDWCLRYPRTVLSFLVLLAIAGLSTYLTIPREAQPDAEIPYIYVNLIHDGISPEDGERLLLRPMERELRAIEGIKTMKAEAGEGYAYVLLEFDAGFDGDKALADVREKVDQAKPKLPADTEEPIVTQVSISLFPVLLVTLSGDVPERTLLAIARQFEDAFEALPDVLSADITGKRDELLEIVVDPLKLESYRISQAELLNIVALNNRLVAAGALDTGAGRFSIKVPGLFETAEDVLSLPVKVSGDGVVTLRDITEIRRTFKDPDTFARVNGKPSLTLEVKKRAGRNIIETVAKVKAIVDYARADLPPNVQIDYAQDASKEIRTMLVDLENSVVIAVFLVMVVVVGSLGLRSAGLVSLTIPGSFLLGLILLSAMGVTLNMLVMFSMILVVGMVVDGGVIVVEYADRKMTEGMGRREAYAVAAKRMAWPVITTTTTTAIVFVPLLFWPGITGKFMSYIPLTLIVTLMGSILIALMFIPVLGAIFGKPGATDEKTEHYIAVTERGDLGSLPGFTGWYSRTLERALHHPGKILLGCVGLLIALQVAYGAQGKGVQFFPEVEPERAIVLVHARGNLSIRERDALMREVEREVLAVEGIVIANTTVGEPPGGVDAAPDTIGNMTIEFAEWDHRRPAAQILGEIRERAGRIAGIAVETRLPDVGPPVGKAVQIELSANLPDALSPVADRIRAYLETLPGLIDIEDSRPLPGIDWVLRVDRAQAGRFGADITSVGNAVQLVTNGVKIGDYRPDDADEEIDIRVRFPAEMRNLDAFDQLRLETRLGQVPISSFVDRVAEPTTGKLKRIDGKRVITLQANVAAGILADDKVREIKAWLAAQHFDRGVAIQFRGQDEEAAAAGAFLGQAFFIGLFLMAIILITQFNSFYATFVILSAVALSTIGVFAGLLITGQLFSMVMTGIGVISLAGVVVAHNVVLIDTYKELRDRGMEPYEAILRTGAQRMRPVLLTTFTTIIGILPMAFSLTIDVFGREVTVGAPSAQWWVQLATAVAFGLAFATVLTLVVTPCLLALPLRLRETWGPRLRKLGRRTRPA